MIPAARLANVDQPGTAVESVVGGGAPGEARSSWLTIGARLLGT